jgi:hypothetical protein
MFVTPERRISSWVMTKIAAAASVSDCDFFDTEVTFRSISDSRGRVAGSISSADDGWMKQVTKEKLRDSNDINRVTFILKTPLFLNS